jgi:hypothetical protein
MEIAGVLFFLVFIAFFALMIGLVIWWIMAIVEIVKLPDYAFKAAGSDRTTWILVVVLAGQIGALIWYFTKRTDVIAASKLPAATPAGYYPDPTTGQPRWWDGTRWY